MRATELMCGDLILADGRPIRIYGVMERMNRFYDTMTNDVSIKRCEPIPLTPEILEKNGFETQELGGGRVVLWTGFGDDNQYDIEIEFREDKTIYTKIDGPTYFVSWRIKHVHKLQHALRLCGIEKEITI